MATGIQANGTDLDSLFLARSTTKRADVNIDSNGGVDISNRFEKYTSGTKVATTNIQSGGTDLKDLFQNISEPLNSIGGDWDGTFLGFPSGSTEEPNTSDAIIEFRSTGFLAITEDGTTTATYTWLTTTGTGEGAGFYMKHVVSTSSGVGLNTGNATANNTWYELSANRDFGCNCPNVDDYGDWYGTIYVNSSQSETGAVSDPNAFCEAEQVKQQK